MKAINHSEIMESLYTASSLENAGFSPSRIYHMVRRKDLIRIAYSTYTRTDVWESWSQDTRSYALHCAYMLTHTGFYFSHVSAAMFLGLDILKAPDRIHVVVDGSPCPSREGTVKHRSTEAIISQCTHTPELVPVTSVLQTVLDCAKTMYPQDALLIADSAVRPDTIRGQLAEFSEVKDTLLAPTRVPGSKRARRIGALVSPLSESAAETIVRFALHEAGFPTPAEQYEVVIGHRKVCRLDFAWPERKLFLEVDGKSKYFDYGDTNEKVYLENIRQHAVTDLTGWKCIRVRWSDFMPDPAPMIRRLAPYFH